jgi:hypothetical protein
VDKAPGPGFKEGGLVRGRVVALLQKCPKVHHVVGRSQPDRTEFSMTAPPTIRS